LVLMHGSLGTIRPEVVSVSQFLNVIGVSCFRLVHLLTTFRPPIVLGFFIRHTNCLIVVVSVLSNVWEIVLPVKWREMTTLHLVFKRRDVCVVGLAVIFACHQEPLVGPSRVFPSLRPIAFPTS